MPPGVLHQGFSRQRQCETGPEKTLEWFYDARKNVFLKMSLCLSLQCGLLLSII